MKHVKLLYVLCACHMKIPMGAYGHFYSREKQINSTTFSRRLALLFHFTNAGKENDGPLKVDIGKKSIILTSITFFLQLFICIS